jgi:sirohydrochlorin ferrochelatase
MRHPRLSASGADLFAVSGAITLETANKDDRQRAPLVAVAHGSRDPRAAATINELLALVRSRAAARGLAGLDVRGAFLDHAAPSPRQVLSGVAESDGSCVVVPLLLTAAYHSKTDIPAHIAAAAPALPGLDVRYADTLGPDWLLLAGLERRLAEGSLGDAGRRSSTSVVLAAAGSSDPAANATIAALAARWQAAGGWRRVVPAYASAVGPRPDEAVRTLLAAEPGTPVIVATYLLAPGYFADKIRAAALRAGAAAVSPALGAAPEVADVILDRYAAAARPVEASASMLARALVPYVTSCTSGDGPAAHGG